MNLRVNLAGVTLEHPIFNAAGPRCTTPEHLHELSHSLSSAIVSKSCTPEQRDGNQHPKYHEFGPNSINSNGLENLGYKAYLELLPHFGEHVGKPTIISVSGLCLADNLEMIKGIGDTPGVDLIELNLSCPNVVGKPQMGYDFEQSRQVLEEVAKICKKPLGVKLPPYFDFAHYKQMADILNNSTVQFVTCINSLGNGLVIDPETEQVAIRPKGGFGGIGGSITKPFGLANVRKMRELLKPEIQVIGVGGITKGSDVFEYILAGADAVQLGTVYMQEGPEVFERILAEFLELLEKKGYTSLEDFRGKLKTFE